MSAGLRVVVLASGEGTNLQAVIDAVHGREGIEIVGVAAGGLEARALARARAAGIPSAVFAQDAYPTREDRDRALGDWVAERRAGLVLLAGWMELLTPTFVRRFAGQIINVHPSLLPSFPGLGAIEQALEYGVRVSGVTVHFVDEGVDTGAIILQEAVDLPYPPRIAAIEERIHEVEHRLVPLAVRLFARGAVRTDPRDPRRVVVQEEDRASG